MQKIHLAQILYWPNTSLLCKEADRLLQTAHTTSIYLDKSKKWHIGADEVSSIIVITIMAR